MVCPAAAPSLIPMLNPSGLNSWVRRRCASSSNDMSASRSTGLISKNEPTCRLEIIKVCPDEIANPSGVTNPCVFEKRIRSGGSEQNGQVMPVTGSDLNFECTADQPGIMGFASRDSFLGADERAEFLSLVLAVSAIVKFSVAIWAQSSSIVGRIGSAVSEHDYVMCLKIRL